MRILLLHGANLNLLGEREPEMYGTTTLEEINDTLIDYAEEHHSEVRVEQSNHEGRLIDLIHKDRKWMDALIFNPGAFTHYSYALRDAVAAVGKPMIEVHLTDPMQRGLEPREAFRLVSVFDGLPNVERIAGIGAEGYMQALRKLLGMGEFAK